MKSSNYYNGDGLTAYRFNPSRSISFHGLSVLTESDLTDRFTARANCQRELSVDDEKVTDTTDRTEAVYKRVAETQYTPTQLCFGPAIHPCPSNNGTAFVESGEDIYKAIRGIQLTSIERTADPGDDDLKSQEGAHSQQH